MTVKHAADHLFSYCFGTVLRRGGGAIFGEKELQSTSYFCDPCKQVAKLVEFKTVTLLTLFFLSQILIMLNEQRYFHMSTTTQVQLM
jgi:hypothetical protein